MQQRCFVILNDGKVQYVKVAAAHDALVETLDVGEGPSLNSSDHLAAWQWPVVHEYQLASLEENGGE